jgi:hypothetical protein
MAMAIPIRIRATGILVALALGYTSTARGQSAADDRALEIARQALDAVRQGWALGRYDDASQVRAAINLRGAGAQGVTANLVLDRSAPRWRLDTAGGLALTVGRPRPARAHVPR